MEFIEPFNDDSNDDNRANLEGNFSTWPQDAQGHIGAPSEDDQAFPTYGPLTARSSPPGQDAQLYHTGMSAPQSSPYLFSPFAVIQTGQGPQSQPLTQTVQQEPTAREVYQPNQPAEQYWGSLLFSMNTQAQQNQHNQQVWPLTSGLPTGTQAQQTQHNQPIQHISQNMTSSWPMDAQVQQTQPGQHFQHAPQSMMSDWHMGTETQQNQHNRHNQHNQQVCQPTSGSPTGNQAQQTQYDQPFQQARQFVMPSSLMGTQAQQTQHNQPVQHTSQSMMSGWPMETEAQRIQPSQAIQQASKLSAHSSLSSQAQQTQYDQPVQHASQPMTSGWLMGTETQQTQTINGAPVQTDREPDNTPDAQEGFPNFRFCDLIAWAVVVKEAREAIKEGEQPKIPAEFTEMGLVQSYRQFANSTLERPDRSDTRKSSGRKGCFGHSLDCLPPYAQRFNTIVQSHESNPRVESLRIEANNRATLGGRVPNGPHRPRPLYSPQVVAEYEEFMVGERERLEKEHVVRRGKKAKEQAHQEQLAQEQTQQEQQAQPESTTQRWLREHQQNNGARLRQAEEAMQSMGAGTVDPRQLHGGHQMA